MVHRMDNIDVSWRFSRARSRLLAQLGFGAICAAAMIAVHILIYTKLPHASPFALVYPCVVLATLYGHWRAGLIAGLITFGYAWNFMLPVPGTSGFEDAAGPARVMVSAASAALVLLSAETFRRFVFAAVEERDAEIVRRALLMRELEHRTKNNFALVVSLLEMQRRAASDPRVGEALDLATARVHSFARSYAALEPRHGGEASVAMKPYLTEIVARLVESAFHERVKVVIDLADFHLPRATAVALALFVNEALTNCMKYAFPGQRRGRVEVCLRGGPESWELSIGDNGVGEAAARTAAASTGGGEGGLGTRLMCAFAEQARAKIEVETTERGRCVRLVRIRERSATPWREALRTVLPAARPRAKRWREVLGAG